MNMTISLPRVKPILPGPALWAHGQYGYSGTQTQKSFSLRASYLKVFILFLHLGFISEVQVIMEHYRDARWRGLRKASSQEQSHSQHPLLRDFPCLHPFLLRPLNHNRPHSWGAWPWHRAGKVQAWWELPVSHSVDNLTEVTFLPTYSTVRV